MFGGRNVILEKAQEQLSQKIGRMSIDALIVLEEANYIPHFTFADEFKKVHEGRKMSLEFLAIMTYSFPVNLGEPKFRDEAEKTYWLEQLRNSGYPGQEPEEQRLVNYVSLIAGQEVFDHK